MYFPVQRVKLRMAISQRHVGRRTLNFYDHDRLFNYELIKTYGYGYPVSSNFGKNNFYIYTTKEVIIKTPPLKIGRNHKIFFAMTA